MSVKVPIRTVYDNSNNAIGLSEFQSGEVVGYLHGGTGLSSLGSAGQVLQINSSGDGFEFGSKTSVNLNPYLQVTNANVTFVTKATALTTNNAIVNLINDRMQVANVNSLVNTQTARIDLVNTNLTSTNTSIRSLVSDRLQVANAAAIYSTLTQLGNTNSYIANKAVTAVSFTTGNNTLRVTTGETQYDATIDVSDKATWTALTTTNTAIRSLVSDRLQVANAIATYSTLTQLGNTNSYIASVQTALDTQEAKQASDLANTNNYIATESARIDLVNTNLTSTNTAIRNLVSDRLQVANATSLFVNVAGDTMSGALAMGSNKITGLGTPTAGTDATTKTYVDTQVASVVDSAPETLNTLNELAAALGDDANFATTTATTLGTKAANSYVNATFATKAYAAANTYVNAQIGASNTSIRNYSDATYVTKSTAVTSNNNLLSLINDRIQVANVASSIRPSVSTVTSNTSVDATDHNNAIIINSADTVVITVAASADLTVGDTFKFYPVNTGDIRIDLDSGDQFIGTNLSTTQINAFSDALITTLQTSQISGASNRDFVTTGLYTKVELLYAGSGNFVLTK